MWETRGPPTRSQKAGSASKLDLLFIIIILSISAGRSRFPRESPLRDLPLAMRRQVAGAAGKEVILTDLLIHIIIFTPCWGLWLVSSDSQSNPYAAGALPRGEKQQ